MRPFGDQLLGEPDMTELEALDLRLHPGRLDPPCHLAQKLGGRQKSAVAEIERTAIECANLRPELLDMCDPGGGVGHVRPGPARGRVRPD